MLSFDLKPKKRRENADSIGDDLVGTPSNSGGLSGMSEEDYSTSLHASKSFTSLQDDDLEFKRHRYGKYLQGILLGHGSFGAVYEGYDTVDRKVVALKVCSSRRKTSLQQMTHAIDQVASEIRILEQLEHNRFIVEFLGHFRADDDNVCVAYRMIHGQNLHHLASGRGGLEASQTRHIAWSILQGLSWLKENGVIHGDIKPENVIISTDHQVVISDFGCACLLSECHPERFKEVARLSPAFQSPEIADESPCIDWFALDMWAVGIVLYFSATGQYPFNGDEGILTLLEDISRCEIPFDRVDPEPLRDMCSMLLTQSETRVNLQQCLQMPFLRDYHGLDLDDTDRSLWVTPMAPELTFVNGVAPSMYEKRDRKFRKKKSSGLDFSTSLDHSSLTKSTSGGNVQHEGRQTLTSSSSSSEMSAATSPTRGGSRGPNLNRTSKNCTIL